jgi:hypothetical protein
MPREYTKADVQKVINIAFDAVLTAAKHDWFRDKDNDEIAAWLREQLEDCGYTTVPIGCSHGTLVE